MYRILLLLVLLTLSVTGCNANMKLVSFSSGPGEEQGGWTRAAPPRAPENQMEEVAVKAAMARSTVQEGGVSAVFLESNSNLDLIAALEAIPGKSGKFDPKRVQYFLVSNALITAYTGTAIQPAPDCEFLRAVHLAATATMSADNRVTLYNNFQQPVTLIGRKLDNCQVKVDVVEGYNVGGRVLFSNTEDLCVAGLY
ncbi:MAG TPA: hypothetical protein DCZ75_11405 [Geobacter sp.]|nr:hypothetical protein [Geobacter sp.]